MSETGMEWAMNRIITLEAEVAALQGELVRLREEHGQAKRDLLAAHMERLAAERERVIEECANVAFGLTLADHAEDCSCDYCRPILRVRYAIRALTTPAPGAADTPTEGA